LIQEVGTDDRSSPLRDHSGRPLLPAADATSLECKCNGGLEALDSFTTTLSQYIAWQGCAGIRCPSRRDLGDFIASSLLDLHLLNIMPRHPKYSVIGTWTLYRLRAWQSVLYMQRLFPQCLVICSVLCACKGEPSRPPRETQIDDFPVSLGDYKACGLDNLLTVLEGTEPFSQASWLSPCGHEARRRYTATCTAWEKHMGR
jgi:hypothetical protein